MSDSITFTDLIGLLGLLAIPYARWVHSRIIRNDDKTEDLAEKIADLKTHVAANYVDHTVSKELFTAVREIRDMLGVMNARLEVLFDRHERKGERSDP